jgi:hypothetical protein
MAHDTIPFFNIQTITLFHYEFKMFFQASENVRLLFVIEVPNCQHNDTHLLLSRTTVLLLYIMTGF